jgi:hypothetical protein
VIGTLLTDRVFGELSLRQIARLVDTNETYFFRAHTLTPREKAAALRSGVLPPSSADLKRTVTRAGTEPTWQVLVRAL